MIPPPVRRLLRVLPNFASVMGDSLQLDRFRQQEKKSETRAAQLYQKGCDGGNAGACQNLGLMYEHGEGGLRKDRAKAREYFDKAHRLGE